MQLEGGLRVRKKREDEVQFGGDKNDGPGNADVRHSRESEQLSTTCPPTTHSLAHLLLSNYYPTNLITLILITFFSGNTKNLGGSYLL